MTTLKPTKPMKAYNPQWSANESTQQTAQKWFRIGFLRQEQVLEVQKTYPLDFYNPSGFLKIGLFIFTILAASFSTSIMTLFFIAPFQSNEKMAIIIEAFVIGIVFTFVLESLIKSRKLYHSGIDNALLYMALGAFCTAIFFIFEQSHPATWLFLLIFLPFFIISVIRYADLVVCCISFFLTLSILISLALTSTWGKTFLPFIVMIFSVGIYFLIKRLSKRDDYLYYEQCLGIAKTLSLVCFYLGGNYWVVREGNALINDLSGAASPQIAFAPVFYSFTLIIPFAYIFFGLRNRDRLILIIGMLTAGFSVFTYRYYFGFLPTEMALTISGFLLIALSGGLIYYLKNNKNGFTYQPDDEREGMNLEALLMSEVVQSKIPQQGETFRFGGGDTGGGGAGTTY
ncbi:hypothetical protein LV89_02262 [Arcicella aurantiaca]|uniref:Membrane protein DUF2157 n=1 Tax=Arcicella aurantiaca TaxID=591202 RepID=A0A316EBQ3_9BACT|nr:hypothetical protein [Arcicella aurantiaca]PWK26753.1 hypothetical protein LV89_02262 [Arcicella aurantiaca]